MINEFSEILRSLTLEDLSRQVGSFCRDAGYQHFIFGSVVEAPGTGARLQKIISNCPNWHELYGSRQYDKSDPVLAHAAKSALPLRWERSVYGARLVDGYSFPVRGRRGDTRLLSVASDRYGDVPYNFTHVAKLSLMANYLQEKLAMIGFRAREDANQQAVELSERERECLQLCSAGKTSDEIGTVLGITARTVNFHISNVARKLNANGRRHAVTKAMLLGLLSFRDSTSI